MEKCLSVCVKYSSILRYLKLVYLLLKTRSVNIFQINTDILCNNTDQIYLFLQDTSWMNNYVSRIFGVAKISVAWLVDLSIPFYGQSFTFKVWKWDFDYTSSIERCSESQMILNIKILMLCKQMVHRKLNNLMKSKLKKYINWWYKKY